MAPSASKHHLPVDAYTVGWISALPVELAASATMLDEEHEDLPFDQSDPTIYTLGSIGKHNVVLACLPAGRTGISPATAVATRMLAKFPSIRVGFLIGVGGGIPTEDNDIRLGDVVVSMPHLDHGGVVQYDSGKAEAEGTFHRTGHLNTPPSILLNTINRARANYFRGKSNFRKYLAAFDCLPDFTRGQTGPDRLFSPNYSHFHGPTCDRCDQNMIIERPSRGVNEGVQIHYGTIASGSTVVKDAVKRDEIAKALGGHILCFETEAAGLMNNFPCLVIRGICDYADSHKQKQWQPYAAATAAAYAKELLSIVPAADVAALSKIKSELIALLSLRCSRSTAL